MNIYALSSGPGVSGIAVVRVSGIHTKKLYRVLQMVKCHLLELQH